MTSVKESTLPEVFFADGEQPGSEAWWLGMAHRGLPMVISESNGLKHTLFLWRERPQQKLRTVYIDVYSHTPHPVREAPTQMQRVGNTDIWYWQTALPKNWCGSYFFMPLEESDAPMPTSSGERRRWWKDMIKHRASADPFNPIPPHNGAWVEPLSGIYPDNVHWLHLEPQGALRKIRWSSPRLGNTRDIWLYRTGDDQSSEAENLPLVILLDGNYWSTQDHLFGELDIRTRAGDLPAALYLLIDSVAPETRDRELPCNPEFWLALQEELLPEVSALEPVTDKGELTLLAGQSYGGLSALWAALRWPHRFGLALSQSGAFWWPVAAVANSSRESEQGNRREKRLSDWVQNSFRGDPQSRKQPRFLVEVGSYEDLLIDDNRATRDVLLQQGFSVEYREFPGGHDWLCWRRSLVEGIVALIGNTAVPHH
ncbi:enterochelin esterase [Microbulbifer thermotolerans]|uniref:enterochelin esterase n=1 Tax=Microbulbifer thermotolerans TaxID=252514 RepID=UPI0008EB470C|nr:enterochelin esterase [Microbulbifer thermotolerans]SFD10376.1 enterochelin esterase [Microbulbifer thermotolerans]